MPRLAVTRPLTPPHGTSRLRRTRGERRPGRPAPRPNGQTPAARGGGQKRARSTCLRPLERGDRATTATRPTPSRPVGALWMAMPMQVLSGHPLARVSARQPNGPAKGTCEGEHKLRSLPRDS
ncbi:hypothetical protein PVAP13_1KG509213 [Panicum virgatum]|uniref:Uncharacterized protein n=1 Tax=Panicum virgatum TaxID=38727 RepID=A0A8T0XRB1_PANVG|nr:hypothetical protein PVAP13_1KG509213 [Panicum virgatum]